METKGRTSGDLRLNQEQVKYRESIQTVRADGIGDLKLFNGTAKFEKTPARVTCPPPRLGAHTEEKLMEIGYSKDEVKTLKTRGVV